MNHSITVENEIAEMTTSVSFNSESEIGDLLKCSMCSKTLTEPRSLQCLHNFCKVCLEKYVARLRGSGKRIETFPCPTCRSEFTLKSDQNVANLASNYFIKNMLETMAIQRQAKGARCSCCRETAVSRCMTCEMYMCGNCSNSHAMWPIMKDHDVIPVKELSNPQSPVKTRNKLHCMKHKDKILEFYCETYQKLSCMHCMVLNHAKKQHRCVSLEKIEQTQKQILKGSCTTLDEILSAGNEGLNAISKGMKALETNATDAKKQIHTQKEKILKNVAEKLEAQTAKLVQDVDKVYGELHDELTKQYNELTDYLNKVQASVSLSKNLLNGGSIEEILSSQKLIDENLVKLRKEQPRNFSPVNDGGIQFSPEDIGTIGCGEIMRKMGNITSC